MRLKKNKKFFILNSDYKIIFTFWRKNNYEKWIKLWNIEKYILISICLLLSTFFIVSSLKLSKNFVSVKYEYKNKLNKIQSIENNKTDSLINIIDSISTQDSEDKLMRSIAEELIKKNPKLKTPSRKEIFDEIDRLNVWYPKYLKAQAIQESSCGQSNLGREYNNLFGMKKPNNRDRCICNMNNKKEVYASYLNWKLSLYDRVLWEKNVFKNKKPSEEEYLNAISGYATHENYKNIIRRIAKKL